MIQPEMKPDFKLTPQRLSAPEWKKFWMDREFASEMKEKGILQQVPGVINRIFHTGPYFLVVVDYRNMTFEFVKGVSQMLGFSENDFYKGNLDFLVSLVHPEDKGKVLGLAVHYYKFLDGQSANKRLDFKVSINFRLQKANGQYIKVLEQVIGLNMDEEGKITHALKYFTDISHLQYSNEVVLAIFDDKQERDQQFYTFNLEEEKVVTINGAVQYNFSEREKEILSMIADGKSSKEIAFALKLSHHTVNKHRENMMRKTGCKNMSEVISFAYCNEYL